jgi:hypothetical protein
VVQFPEKVTHFLEKVQQEMAPQKVALFPEKVVLFLENVPLFLEVVLLFAGSDLQSIEDVPQFSGSKCDVSLLPPTYLLYCSITSRQKT